MPDIYKIEEIICPEDTSTIMRMIPLPYPQLEYVKSWAWHFRPSYDTAVENDEITNKQIVVDYKIEPRTPNSFLKRYFEDKISLRDVIKERYEGAWELHKSLEAYSIDKTKFFYLCLLIKDYIDNYTYRLNPSAAQIIELLIAKLDEMEPDENEWYHGKVKHKAELSLKVDGVRKVFKTNDSVALNIINACLTDFYKKISENPESIFHYSIGFGKKHELKITEKAFLFNKYLKWFLEDKEYKRVAGAERSKALLISRSFYIFKIEENGSDKYYKEKFYDIDGNYNRTFTDLIKKCKDPRRYVRNSVYWY